MAKPQSSFRFSAEPDSRFCARVLCRIPRRKCATHIVTLGDRQFRVCDSCARRWEGSRDAKVELIQKETA